MRVRVSTSFWMLIVEEDDAVILRCLALRSELMIDRLHERGDVWQKL